MLTKLLSWQFYIRKFGPAKTPKGIRVSFFGASLGMLRLIG